MLKCFLGCESSLRLCDQLLDEIFCIVRDIVPFLAVKVKFLLLDHLENLLVVITVERWISAKENVKHASSGPHVAGDVVVTLKDFW